MVLGWNQDNWFRSPHLIEVSSHRDLRESESERERDSERETARERERTDGNRRQWNTLPTGREGGREAECDREGERAKDAGPKQPTS